MTKGPVQYLNFFFRALMVASFLWMEQRHKHPMLEVETGGEGSNTTVIVGAGVAGLCTAYHLAKAIHESATKNPHHHLHRHKIIVVDSANEAFAATSSTNTGIISYTGFEEDLLPLARYSYDQWETLGRENTHFKTRCGYREGANVALKNGSLKGEDIPNWIHADPEWYATKDPPHSKMAIINPVALGMWLYEQCLDYGVEFRMSTSVTDADMTMSHTMLSLNVIDNNKNNKTASVLRCDNLVIAAGPWSPALFKVLFPWSPVKFDPVISAGDWIVFENPVMPADSEIAAVYIDDIVGHKLEFAGRNDHTIWATGEKSGVGKVPNVEEEPEPDQRNLAKLKAYADTFLNHDITELRVISQGRSYRPTTRTRLPVIAGIPPCRLSKTTVHCNDSRTSVYLNSGHGSYGVTLGMGSGKIMSQILMHKEPDLAVSKFGAAYNLL